MDGSSPAKFHESANVIALDRREATIRRTSQCWTNVV